MDAGQTYALIAAERRRAADWFATLDDEQLDMPSLCGEWTVRDVAGHLISPFCVTPARAALRMVTAGGFTRFNARFAKELGGRPIGDIADTLRANAEHRFRPPGLPAAAPLSDVCIHTRDAARPLGQDVSASPEAWRGVLDFVVTPQARRAFVRRGLLDGLRLRATDVRWAHGAGDEVAGPAEALALASAGRGVALDDLAGPGVDTLRGRLA